MGHVMSPDHAGGWQAQLPSVRSPDSQQEEPACPSQVPLPLSPGLFLPFFLLQAHLCV